MRDPPRNKKTPPEAQLLTLAPRSSIPAKAQMFASVLLHEMPLPDGRGHTRTW